jgi:hypothetical protein
VVGRAERHAGLRAGRGVVYPVARADVCARGDEGACEWLCLRLIA